MGLPMNCAGYVPRKDAKAQESDQVDHARDYAEQGREPPFRSRERVSGELIVWQ
jgi:hypothetical protein